MFQPGGDAAVDWLRPLPSARREDDRHRAHPGDLPGDARGGLVGALGGGRRAVIRHFVLRARLVLARCAPFRYVPFLEYATALLLLERNGGAYRFRHDLLQRYFADLRPSAETASGVK